MPPNSFFFWWFIVLFHASLSHVVLPCKQCAPYFKMYLWRRNIIHTLSCPSILILQHTKQKATHGKVTAGRRRKEGQKEAWTDEWKRQTWWIYGGPEWSRPCGVVGIAVMQTDAWLFASAFTVNTKKHKKEKKTTMRANEEIITVNIQNDAKPQQILLRGSNRPGSRDLMKIYSYRKVWIHFKIYCAEEDHIRNHHQWQLRLKTMLSMLLLKAIVTEILGIVTVIYVQFGSKCNLPSIPAYMPCKPSLCPLHFATLTMFTYKNHSGFFLLSCLHARWKWIIH